jgi:hypothetical protein
MRRQPGVEGRAPDKPQSSAGMLLGTGLVVIDGRVGCLQPVADIRGDLGGSDEVEHRSGVLDVVLGER